MKKSVERMNGAAPKLTKANAPPANTQLSQQAGTRPVGEASLRRFAAPNNHGADPGCEKTNATDATDATDPNGAAHSVSQTSNSDLIAVLMIAFFECSLVGAGIYLNWHAAWILAGHFAIFAGGLYLIYVAGHNRRDISALYLAVLATLGIGPLGAIGALVVTVMGRKKAGPPQLLEEWYERISHSTDVDEVTQFCDMVAIGRALNLSGPAPLSFAAVMQEGSLRDKQNALGLMARKFHPDYLPALHNALQSDQPVIRVQAAAVAAHVRDAIKLLARELIGQLDNLENRDIDDADFLTPTSGLKLARMLEQCLSSGLLDEGDRAACRQAIDQLTDRLRRQIQGDDGGERSAAISNSVSMPEGLPPLLSPYSHSPPHQSPQPHILTADEMAAYEALLLKRGAFDAFRALREDAKRYKSKFQRVRPLPFVVSPTPARELGP